jgi:drug/metabolite transporter (DMT)-like permease
MSGLGVALWAGLPAATRGILWMCASSLMYATMYIVLRQLSFTFGALEVIWFRAVFSTLFLLPWLLSVGIGALRTTRFSLHFWRMCATYAAGVAWVYASAHLTLSDVNALMFTSPLFTVLIAAIALGDRGGGRRWATVAVGFLGTLLILRPGVTEVSLAAIVALFSALAFGVGHVLARAGGATENPNAMVFYLYGLQIPLGLGPAVAEWVWPGPVDYLWLAALGLLTMLAQQGLTRSLKLVPVSLAMPFNFLQLPMVSLMALALYGETSSLWTWSGAALICAAAYDLARREGRKAQRSA